MTPHPQDEAEDRKEPVGAPLENTDAARHLEHMGMSADSAWRFAAYHSGLFASFHRTG